MRYLILLINVLIISFEALAQEVPFRSHNDFEVFTSFQLIAEKPVDSGEYIMRPTKKFNPEPIMHLVMTVKIKNVNSKEARLQIYNFKNDVSYGKKLKDGMELNLNFGNFEKVKKREIPYLFTIFILDKKKNKLSKIKVEVLENGAVFINDEPHGKN